MKGRTRHSRLDAVLMSDPSPVILKHWTAEAGGDSVYLDGYVYGHHRIADGTRIRSARLLWVLEDAGIAQTATINYILRDRR